jgi:hypothetical protein
MPASFAVARRATLARIESLRSAEPKHAQARGVDEAGPDAPETFILRRGEYGQRGAVVAPGFPTALRRDGEPADARVASRARSTGRRTALAAWLNRADHPLSSRVIVNRLWQHHFGRGLVASPSDFGATGEPPSHPELLDWLATELAERGGGLKAMHRLMTTSAAYRQSSRVSRAAAAIDPDNELISRFRRVRLDGEAVRDALLAISGRLSGSMGGPPVFPLLPVELTKLSNKGAVWPVSKTEEERSRRSLYVFVRRNLRYPFFEAFDRPDMNASCPRRSSTTTAPQALTLLNSTLARDAADALAARVVQRTGADRDAQVALAFRLTLGRSPDRDEAALARASLDRDPALEHLCLGLINANEFVYVD